MLLPGAREARSEPEAGGARLGERGLEGTCFTAAHPDNHSGQVLFEARFHHICFSTTLNIPDPFFEGKRAEMAFICLTHTKKVCLLFHSETVQISVRHGFQCFLIAEVVHVHYESLENTDKAQKEVKSHP